VAKLPFPFVPAPPEPHVPPPPVASQWTAPGVPGENWPPGFAGVLARFIFETSYNPIQDVAIAATLGLLAGIVGRRYRFSEKDLGIYLLLVARSGIGKDGIHEGIDKVLSVGAVPGSDAAIRRCDFASGPALHKELLREPGFVWLAGEFGRKLLSMADPKNTPMQDLRTVVTKAFGKHHLEGRGYSDQSKSVEGVYWPALSILGETTPETFYKAIGRDMAEDGFLSRFVVIFCESDRPLPNRHRCAELDQTAVTHLRHLITGCLPYHTPMGFPAATCVSLSRDAEEKLDAFELACRDALNAASDDYVRQAYSRAPLKAAKIACLLAVADHPDGPCVSLVHAVWAKLLVHRDISALQQRHAQGDLDFDDAAREAKLLQFVEEYLTKPLTAGYKVPDGLQVKGIVPRAYLQIRARTVQAFKEQASLTRALDLAIKGLVDAGCFAEVPRAELLQDFRYAGRCFRVLRRGI
jgi:hypothetical protein